MGKGNNKIAESAAISGLLTGGASETLLMDQPTYLPPAVNLSDGVVSMRPMQASDAAALLSALDDKVAEFVEYAPPEGSDLAAVEAWIEARNQLMSTGVICDWTIVEESTGEIVGWRCLRNKIITADNPADGKIRTSVFINPDRRGNRLSPRSARLAAQFAFDSGVEELLLALEIENEPSLKNALAAGFKLYETADGLHRLSMTADELSAAEPFEAS